MAKRSEEEVEQARRELRHEIQKELGLPTVTIPRWKPMPKPNIVVEKGVGAACTIHVRECCGIPVLINMHRADVKGECLVLRWDKTLWQIYGSVVDCSGCRRGSGMRVGELYIIALPESDNGVEAVLGVLDAAVEQITLKA